MTGPIKHLFRKHEKLWRVAAGFVARLQALDYTSLDYTQERIDRLEQKLAGLTQELRQNRLISRP